MLLFSLFFYYFNIYNFYLYLIHSIVKTLQLLTLAEAPQVKLKGNRLEDNKPVFSTAGRNGRRT